MTSDSDRRPARRQLALTAVAVAVTAGIAVGAGAAGLADAADDRAATYGTIPDSAYGADGSIDLGQVPDYVVAFGRDGEPVGYVAKADLFTANGAQTVVDRDGTVVGHHRPGYGFVSIDDDSSTVVPIEASAGPMTEN